MQKIISRRKHTASSYRLRHGKGHSSAEDLIAAYDNGAREKNRLLAKSNYIKDVLD